MTLPVPVVWSEDCLRHEPGGEVWLGVRDDGTPVGLAPVPPQPRLLHRVPALESQAAARPQGPMNRPQYRNAQNAALTNQRAAVTILSRRLTTSVLLVKALGGGIAVQDRMAFQGEYFVERYGAQQAKRTPPIRRMLEMGIPVGAGTDATRVSSYNPFLSLYWLITGKTIGGLSLYPEENRLDRQEALKLYTMGSSWFSTEDGKKGALAPGQLADLAVLSGDYFSIPEEEIKHLESVLTIVGGKIVYATHEFSRLAPPALPVSPSWSPVNEYGGYAKQPTQPVVASHSASCSPVAAPAHGGTQSHLQVLGEFGLWGLGCDCFAF